MKSKILSILPFIFAGACADTADAPVELVDPQNECVFCDDRADAFGISRHSYLAYGIVKLANTASLEVLDDDVPLDARAARGIVAGRPFEYIEQVDTVAYVGANAFSAMAQYAEANGFVSFCGDGELQSILEACDDGNNVDGDGCSAACQVEENTRPDFLASQPDLIRGADIGVGIVNPNAYYMRARPYKALPVSDSLKAILDRADVIQANTAGDGIVSFDELAILSKESFYSSLFAAEKDALKDAWSIFEVSSNPVAVVEYKGGPTATEVPFQTRIERVGPLLVDGTMLISDLEDEDQKTVARRLQQMPGANQDGNAATIQFADLEKGMTDYTPVFSEYEVWDMKAIQDLMFKDAAPQSGGDFVIEFDSMPNQGSTVSVLGEFDGWSFRVATNVSIFHDAYDPQNSPNTYFYRFDANLRTHYSFNTYLAKNGAVNSGCTSIYSSTCLQPFLYSGVRFLTLDGKPAVAGRRNTVLMEEWKSGKRIYNRMVEFKNSYSVNSYTSNTYHNTLAAARPVLANGQNLSLRKVTTTSYGSKTYDRFGLTNVQTAFNKNVEKFFPQSASMLEYRLAPGRYNAFEGVVLEVHQSLAVIAYMDGCELPLAFQDGMMESEVCAASGRKVRITFDNIAATLQVIGSSTKEIDIYNQNDLWNNREDRLLGLDRSYYVVQ